MKKILLAILCAGPWMAIAQDLSTFEITGTLKNIQDPIRVITVSYIGSGQVDQDSCVVKDGTYHFSGTTGDTDGAFIQLRVKHADRSQFVQNRDVAVVLLQPGKIEVISENLFSNTQVKGSQPHTDNLSLKYRLQPVEQQISEINEKLGAARGKADEREIDRWMKERSDLYAQIRGIQKQFILDHPNSTVSLRTLRRYAGDELDIQDVEPIFNGLTDRLKASVEGMAFERQMVAARNTEVGQQFVDFTLDDISGNPVGPASFKGKYLLIDFWASWCGPCRADNPHLVKAYDRYHEKGLEMLGVSLDGERGKAAWLKAIEEDKLTWTQVNDVQSPEKSVAVKYGIVSIPQNILIDPSGKIIAKNLHRDSLDKALAEIFK